jgi:hypothetical protein
VGALLECIGAATGDEVPPTEAPTHVHAEVTTTHPSAEVSAVNASAPMISSGTTTRNCLGRDGGTSQCRGKNDDRKSAQHTLSHDRYLSLF